MLAWNLTRHFNGRSSLAEARFAKSVKGKVYLYSPAYNSGGCRCKCGRAWITFNGRQIANFETIPNLNRTHITHEPTSECGRIVIEDGERSPGKLLEKVEFSRFHLCDACREILQLPIEAALTPLAVALLEIRIAEDSKKSQTLGVSSI